MATQNTLRDFGRYLQAHRHARGLSIDHVGRLTRIIPSNLLLIENETLDQLPADVFVKGFLKAYAEAVGADPHEAVSRYEARCHHQMLLDQGQALQYGQRFFYLRFLSALMLMALLIATTLYFAHYRSMHGTTEGGADDTALPLSGESDHGTPSMEQHPEESREAEPTDKAKAEVEVPSQDISGNAADEKAPQRRKEQLLELEAAESSWLKIIVDGGAPRVFNMAPADKLTLKARERFSLLIGNAGGMMIRFNGKPVQITGKSGQVVTLQLP